jgi:hypothetical protein
MNKELTPVANEALIERFMTLALEKDAKLEAIQEIVKMRNQLRAEQAKELFDNAMAAFQSTCPTIQKTKEVRNKPEKGGGLRYKYAPLDSIISQVRELLSMHGFSYRVETEVKENLVLVTCVVTHSFGHSQTSSFSVPIDKESYMTDQQRFGAALTFAKRYAFCNAFGIMTGDEDTDANDTASEPPAPQAQRPEARPRSDEPAPTGEPPKQDGSSLSVFGFITEVVTAPTKTGQKYIVMLGKDKYNTFSSTVANAARELHAKKLKVRIEFVNKGKWGDDITKLEAAKS